MNEKKDYVSVCKEVHKQNLATHKSPCNLQELYTAFKEKQPNVNIGFSKLCAWDPSGVFWLAQKWLTLSAFVGRSSKFCVASRCNGLGLDIQRPDQEDRLQPWEQQIYHASVWILSWHCNSERISWSGNQRTWRWLDIKLLSVGHYGMSNIDNPYSHLRRTQRDFDWYYWWFNKTFLYCKAKNYQFLIQDEI